MHLWLLFLFGITVHGISRISEHDFKAVNFAKALEGWKLNGSVFKVVDVDSEGSCRLKCVEDERCQSFNFGTTKKNKAEKFQCQLSYSDRFARMDNFTKDEDFKYRGVQVT